MPTYNNKLIKLVMEDPALSETRKRVDEYGLLDMAKDAGKAWWGWRKKQWPFREMTEEELGESVVGFGSILKPMAVHNVLRGAKVGAGVMRKQTIGVARRIMQTPYKEIRGLKKVDIYPETFGAEHQGGRQARISFDALKRIRDESFQGRDWWHELAHHRTDKPAANIDELYQSFLRTRVDRELRKIGIRPRIGPEFWEISPAEVHAERVADLVEGTTRSGLILPKKMPFGEAFKKAAKEEDYLFWEAREYLTKSKMRELRKKSRAQAGGREEAMKILGLWEKGERL